MQYHTTHVAAYYRYLANLAVERGNMFSVYNYSDAASRYALAAHGVA